jgi:S1-C subfamily serine protease
MTQSPDVLTSFSNAFADSVESAAASVVQVRGARVVASGLVYAPDTVATMASVVGREDGLHVRRGDGTTLDAELAGWDPTTGLAVLHVAGLGGTPIAPSTVVPRVGHLVLAVGRSWSNAVSASAGIVSVIGGPLPHGRRRAIEQVIRTTAPMHDGFAGGALIDTAGGLIGIATSLRIRGTAVAIPVPVAWKAVSTIVEHGHAKRGYLGIVGQPVRLPDTQRAEHRERGLLIAGIASGGPADKAGVLVGDIVFALDEHPIESPEDLLDLLAVTRVGAQATLRMLRGGTPVEIPITIGERPKD